MHVALIDVALLAELVDLLVPALETMASEASSLGLEVNWQKTYDMMHVHRGNISYDIISYHIIISSYQSYHKLQ